MAIELTSTAALPLVRELDGSLTPWQACRRLADLPHLLLLDSAQRSSLGRYSFVSADPVAWASSGRAGRRKPPENAAPEHAPRDEDPFLLMRHLLAAEPLPTIPDLPPFQGGIAGLWGYELGRWIEKLPTPRCDDFQVPEIALGLYDWVLAWDHQTDRSWLVSTGRTSESRTAASAPRNGQPDNSARARRRLAQVLAWLDRPDPPLRWQRQKPIPLATAAHSVPSRPELLSNFDEPSYLRTIRRAIDYVHAGDCFQVNVAQRLVTPQHEPPLVLYERLREKNPAPFAAYLDLGDFAIVSASPERFLRVHDRRIETRPIKGTRPRGRTPEEDFARADDLRESAKDRAENVMIVDLLRNDLGRVCEYGSVRVESVCRLESYRYVHHLVSEVRGRLREGLDAVDLLRATFPGGSVTGAPKIRAMEIITELEQVARGAYCGCLGYVGFDGSMDTNLLIRTITLGKGWATFSVGGGIVADSDPRKEYEETWHKAAGLLRGLEE